MNSSISHQLTVTEHGNLFAFTVAGVHEWWFGRCVVLQRKSHRHARDPDVWHFNGLPNHVWADQKNEVILFGISTEFEQQKLQKKINTTIQIYETSISLTPNPEKQKKLCKTQIATFFPNFQVDSWKFSHKVVSLLHCHWPGNGSNLLGAGRVIFHGFLPGRDGW